MSRPELSAMVHRLEEAVGPVAQANAGAIWIRGVSPVQNTPGVRSPPSYNDVYD